MKASLFGAADRALLQACLLTGEDGRRAFETWKPFATPELLDGRILRMMPLLFRNLETNGVEDSILPWLKGLAKHVWLTGALRARAALAQVQKAEAVGIPVVLIKGAALCARWEDEADTRPMGDFDILVPPDRLRETLHILRNSSPDFISGDIISDADIATHHAVPVPLGHPHLWIDLHWRPAAAIEDRDHARVVIARTDTSTLMGTNVRVLSLADHLFVLMAHALYNLSSRRIDWVTEASLLLRRFGDTIDWDIFHGLVRTYDMAIWTKVALDEVSAIGGLPTLAGSGQHSATASYLQTREIAARRARAPSTMDEQICAVSDGGRARDLDGLWKRDRAMIASASRFSRILPEPICFRLVSEWERRDLDLASLETGKFDASRDNARDSFLHGWSIPQRSGRWSVGARAWALFATGAAETGDVHLRVTGLPHVPTGATQLLASVWAGGSRERWRFDLDADGLARQTIRGRIRNWRGQAAVPLFIHFLTAMDAISRRRTDTDDRQLGLYLQAIDMGTRTTVPMMTETIDFTRSDICELTFWSRWGPAEAGGRWTIGDEARLLVHLPAKARRLRLVASMALVAPPASSQGLEIFVDGVLATTVRIAVDAPDRPVDFVIPPPKTDVASLREICLRPTTPISPREIGLSADSRRLGVMVRSLTILD